jgi:hypothetical protein
MGLGAISSTSQEFAKTNVILGSLPGTWGGISMKSSEVLMRNVFLARILEDPCEDDEAAPGHFSLMSKWFEIVSPIL